MCQGLEGKVVSHGGEKARIFMPTDTIKGQRRSEVKNCMAICLYFNSKLFLDSVVFVLLFFPSPDLLHLLHHFLWLSSRAEKRQDMIRTGYNIFSRAGFHKKPFCQNRRAV